MRQWMRIVETADHPTILYHTASAGDRASIMQDGLLRRKSWEHLAAVERNDGITTDENPWGGIFFASKPSDQRGFDLWQVDVRGLSIEPDIVDPEDPEDTWWVTYDEDVAPDRLKLVHAGTLREAALLENVVGQRQLEVLATHIIDALVDNIVYRLSIKWRDDFYSDWDILGHISTYYDLSKRLPRAMRSLAKRDYGIRVKLTAGASYYEGAVLKLHVPNDFLQFAIQHKDDAKALRVSLMRSFPDLVHELSHLYDDRRSKGKYIHNLHSQNTQRLQQKMYDDPSDDAEAAWSNSYMTDPAEVNAWFQQAVSAIHGYRDENFETYRDAFESQYPHYRQLSDKRQQRLVKRLYAQWESGP